MRDLSYVLALFGILVLAGAIIAWWRIHRTPDEQPPSEANRKRSNSAAKIILLAVLLSGLAAAAAVFGWFQR